MQRKPRKMIAENYSDKIRGLMEKGRNYIYSNKKINIVATTVPHVTE